MNKYSQYKYPKCNIYIEILIINTMDIYINYNFLKILYFVYTYIHVRIHCIR